MLPKNVNPSLQLGLDFTRQVDPPEVGMSVVGVERIRALFAEMLATHLHEGAQLVIARHGRVVLDLCGGIASRKRNDAVLPVTPFLVFSVTKPFTAICIHHLLENGALELDAPIASYWPEFGCKGKETATLRHALLHQAGIPERGMRKQLIHWPNWGRVTHNVASLPAEFPPGSQSAYHTVNFGFILGEVVRRVSGMPVDAYLKKYFLDPLCMRSTSLGLPPAWKDRAAGIYTSDRVQRQAVFVFSIPAIRQAVIPAATLNSSARDLAVFYQMLCNGGTYAGWRYLKPETLAQATHPGYEGIDGTIKLYMRWALGFHLGNTGWQHKADQHSFGNASRVTTFGHGGQASCITWCDPSAGLVLAFTCNRLLNTKAASRRWRLLGDAAWDALYEQPSAEG